MPLFDDSLPPSLLVDDRASGAPTALPALPPSLLVDDRQPQGGLVHQLIGTGPGTVAGGFEYAGQRFNQGVGNMVQGVGSDVGYLGGKLADLTQNAPLASEAIRAGAQGIQQGATALAAPYQQVPPPTDLGQKVTGGVAEAVGGLPRVVAATEMGGARLGFAGLGALQAAKQGSSLGQVLEEAAKGYLAGASFEATGPLTRAPRAVAQSAIGAAQSPDQPLQGAATMGILGQFAGPGEVSGRDVLAMQGGAAGAAARAANIVERLPPSLLVDDRVGPNAPPSQTAQEPPGSTQAAGTPADQDQPAPAQPAQPEAAPAPYTPPIRSEADLSTSPEDINRRASEAKQGVTFERVDTRSGQVRPLPNVSGRIDQLQAGPWDVVRRVDADGTVQPVSIGERVTAFKKQQALDRPPLAPRQELGTLAAGRQPSLERGQQGQQAGAFQAPLQPGAAGVRIGAVDATAQLGAQDAQDLGIAAPLYAQGRTKIVPGPTAAGQQYSEDQFAGHETALSQATGETQARETIGIGKRFLFAPAVQMDDGQVFASDTALHHADVVTEHGLDPDRVASTGFVVRGEYQAGTPSVGGTQPRPEAFDALASQPGPVADFLNHAATQIAAGAAPEAVAGDLAPDAADRVRAAVASDQGAGAPVAPAPPAANQAAGVEAQPAGAQRLTSETGAVVFPNPREWVQKGRDYVAQVYQEQAQIQQQQLARQIEASRQRAALQMRGMPEQAGSEKAPPALGALMRNAGRTDVDYLGREIPQTEGALQSPGKTRDIERLAPTIGEAFGPEADQVLHGIASVTRGDIEYARRGVVSDKALKASASDQAAEWIALANDDPRLLASIRGRGEALSGERLLAAKEVAKHFLARFATEAAGTDPKDLERMVQTLRLGLIGRDALAEAVPDGRLVVAGHQAIDALLQLTGATAEAGRALRATGLSGADARTRALTLAAKRLIGGDSPEEVQAKLADFMGKVMQVDPNDAIALSRMLADLGTPPMSDRFYRYMRNAYLSAIPGRTATMLSDAIMALRRPAGTLIAAPVDVLRAKLTGTPREVFAGSAVNDFMGMYLAAPTAARSVLRTLITQTTAGYSGITEHGSAVAPPEGVIGRGLNLPVTVVSAMREGWKVMNEAGALHSEAFRLAKQAGLDSSSDAFAQYMAAVIRHPERVEGLLDQLAAERAYRTWEAPNRLVDASIAFRKAVPGVRYWLPFIQTPINIATRVLGDVFEPGKTFTQLAGTLLRTPAGETRLVQAMGKLPEGRQLSEQLSRTAVGMLISGAVAYLAAQGKIIGTGPPDQKEQRDLRAMGWQNNSIKVGGQYLSFNRLEPLGGYLSVVADLQQASALAMMEGTDMLTKLGGVFAHDVAENFVNKTYMRGLADVLGTITNYEEHQAAPAQFLAGVIPAGVSTAARAMDPRQVRARTLSEVMQSRIPGLRQNLYPYRDVWGEAMVDEGGLVERLISPVERRKVLDDPETLELQRLGYVPSSPMEALDLHGQKVKLTPQEYDQYVERQGQLAKNWLSQVMAGDSYKNLPDTPIGENVRRSIVRKFFSRAREVARKQLLPNVLPRSLLEQHEQEQLDQLNEATP